MKQREEIRICVDLRKLNGACVHDPFPTPFTDEFLDNVGGQEAYSFTDGFSRYHQINIVLKDSSKVTFATEWGMLLVYGDAFWSEECTDNLFARSHPGVQGFHSQIFRGIL